METLDSALIQICTAAREQGGQLLNPPLSEITKDLSNVTSGKSVLPKIAYPYITEYFRACVTFNFSAALRVSSYQISSKENNIHNFVLPSEKKIFLSIFFCFSNLLLQASNDLDTFVREQACIEPFVVVSGEEAFIAAEKSVIFKVEDPANIPASLLAVYFGFGVKYQPGHKSLLLFLEYAIREKTHTKMNVVTESTISALSRMQ